MEKNRRKAFWGLQIKYSLGPILWIYGIVFAVLTGLFMFNWCTKVKGAEYEVAFLEQITALPLEFAFLVLVLGVQIVLMVAISKQEKQKLAMLRVPLPEETKELIRWIYSLLVTVSAFLVYFLMLCLLLLLENLLDPATAYGMSELYPVFYSVVFLFRMYPVVSAGSIPIMLTCILAVSAMAPLFAGESWEEIRDKIVWGVLLIPSFLSYCFEAKQTSFLDLILLGLCGVCIIGKLILLYRRRQKHDKEELVERVE